MFLLERGNILGGPRDLDRFISVRELVDFPGMPGTRWRLRSASLGEAIKSQLLLCVLFWRLRSSPVHDGLRSGLSVY